MTDEKKLEGFLEVDYDEETIKSESQEVTWADGATVMVQLNGIKYHPYNDKRVPGAKGVGVFFTIGVVDPETGSSTLPMPIKLFCGMPLKSPDTPDKQPPDFTLGDRSEWTNLCKGFVDEYNPLVWEGGQATVNGVKIDRAEIDGVKAQLGSERVKLAKDLYKSQFESIIGNSCYATIKLDGSWTKLANMRTELKDGEELTEKEDLRVRGGGK